ncbi:histidine phosphatase family protein [Parafrigoribacterium soli]|uniref:histidine phosphatase family protein n=1 Tax=Parafrigoribacterium soli TaxID=3144663 RepID=UPI0032EC28C0
MTFLYLVRHGETDWNRQRRIQGSTDIPLNATGRLQAERTGRLLARRYWDGIFSSPLSRAYETAAIIADELGLGEPTRFDEIVERAYGDAEGLNHEELSRLYPRGSSVPGRESREDVAARVVPALVRLAEEHPRQHLIVTTHGGVIRSVLNTIAPGSPTHRGVPISNGSIHSFRLRDGELELVAFDDPIEEASVEPGSADLSEQNALEQRESAEG